MVDVVLDSVTAVGKYPVIVVLDTGQSEIISEKVYRQYGTLFHSCLKVLVMCDY